MKPVILLDIDGVLNPTVCPNGGGDRPLLRLSHEKRALARRLARSGRIGWVSTWPADMVAGLEAQLELDVEPRGSALGPGKVLTSFARATATGGCSAGGRDSAMGPA